MRIVTEQQRTPEWLKARAGCVTASNVAAVLSKFKRESKAGDETAERRNYKMRVICETLTGLSQDTYVTPAMAAGMDYEPFAKAAYEVAKDVEIRDVGFILHPTIARCGASPDGLIGEDGMIEAKCPTMATHLDYLLADAVPEDYKPQMLLGMVCAERQWCDFISHHKDFPDGMQLFVKRFPRDAEAITAMEVEILKFQRECDEVIFRLQRDLTPILKQSVEAVSR